MSAVTGQITLAAPARRVWDQLSDPRQLPKWWPRVSRVELNGEDSFTELLTTKKGRDVRADFVTTERSAPTRWTFRQELEQTPFAAVLRTAQTSLLVTALTEAVATVEITIERKPRGLSRLGGPMMRRATRRQLDEALQRLGEIHGTVS